MATGSDCVALPVLLVVAGWVGQTTRLCVAVLLYCCEDLDYPEPWRPARAEVVTVVVAMDVAGVALAMVAVCVIAVDAAVVLPNLRYAGGPTWVSFLVRQHP